MKTRSQTLMQNMGIYGSIIALLLCHMGVWGVLIRNYKKEVQEKTDRCKQLENMVVQMKAQKDRFEAEVQRTEAELREREEELQSYGDFLPSLQEKGDILQKILQLIENDLGLSIESQEYQDPVPGTGGAYYTFEFSLKLKGPYQGFKMLLNQIQQTTMIIRIQEFNVTDYGRDNDKYMWQADAKFQTYFSR